MRAGRVLGALTVVLAIGAVVGVNLRQSSRQGEPVDVEPVARRRIVGVVEASGRLSPVVSVDLSSDVIGRVVEVRAREGDTVRQGDLLIRIDPTQYQYRLKSAAETAAAARSRLSEVESNLWRARRDYERDKSLREQDLLPEKALDASRAALDTLEAQVRTARHSAAQTRAGLEEAEEALRKTELRAPMDGVVVRRRVEVGETAISGTLNNQGSLLMTIADLTAMRAEVDVDETDVVSVRAGMPAEVKLDAFPNRSFPGTVSEVARSATSDGGLAAGAAQGQSKSADFKVRVQIDAADPNLLPGLSATVRITTEVRPDAVAVPIQAVVVREVPLSPDPAAAPATLGPAAADAATPPSSRGPREEREGVFVVAEGKARFRPIALGLAGERYFEVRTGLDPGAQVVKGPFQTLRRLGDGDRVRPREVEAEADKARIERRTGE